MSVTAPTAPRLHQLSNGVRLVCDPLPAYETLALSVVAGRGARWEDEARNGWSHLLEHMVFKGAGNRSARALVEDIEAKGGQINAATGYERTSFQTRALRDGLPLAMEITADLIQRPTLDPGDLEREKQVVAQEIAEADDTPDDRVFELAQSAAFAGQPLGRPILGKVERLAEADPATLETWRRRLYGPDRLVVSAAGAVDEDAFLKAAELAFGDMPVSQDPTADPESATFVGGAAPERRRLEQAHLVWLLPAVGLHHPDYWTWRILAEALGGGMSSRLFQEARERLGLAYAIDAWLESWTETGVIGVYAGCTASAATQLASVVAREIRAMAQGLTRGELARCQAQLKASLFMSRESLLNRAEQNAAQLSAFGRLVPSIEMAGGIDAVSADAVSTCASRLIASGLSASATLGPAAAEKAADRFARDLFH